MELRKDEKEGKDFHYFYHVLIGRISYHFIGRIKPWHKSGF